MLKRNFTVFILSFFFVQISGNLAISQDSWSLEQCINYAFENNIQIKQQSLNVELSENQLLRAKYSAYPSLNASANHNYSFGRTTNFITNQKERSDIQSTSFSVSSQVNLFNGFQTSNTKKQEAINLQASISDVEKLKNSIALNIAAAYLQILFNEELVETNRKQFDLSSLQLERTRVMVQAGSLPEGNLLEIEAQLASDELQLVNAQNQLDLAILNLVQMLDLENTEGFSIQRPSLDGFNESLPSDSPMNIFNTAQENLPQIMSASLRLSSAEKGVLIAKGARSPRLSFGASYGTGAQKVLSNTAISMDPFMDQVKDNANTNVGLSLTIPIFNGFQVKTAISNSLINLDNARLSLEYEKLLLYKDIQQAFADAIAAFKKFNATEKNLNALGEAFRYSEQKFNLGLVTSFDYTTAKTRLAKAETDLLQAKYEYIFKTKILDFYRGVPLKL
ncbi:MAG TPA: TolC family protein [Tenuifilaceae bacterium]|nr:TolC family protein [Tenuifilaceae bacterium]HPE17029.1 TolC family protein [Tenuifilaceae bacterium]HPJ44686.1 TolC family protein [Tenuifilaceae bacterium]HPQ32950.1 TolC family protein [Tenuifilaceae bacterium]